MFTATPDFITAALSDYRDPRARVEIIWTDSIIDSTIEAYANDVNRLNFIPQVYNQTLITSRKWAHLNNKFIADGSFHPMPSNLYSGEVGWYGGALCDASGYWVINPVLTLEFSDRPIASINLVFDTVYAEYAEEFTIKAYNNSVIVHTETVTGNTSVSQSLNLSSYNIFQCDKITLEVIKWSEGNQVCKVCEFYGDISQVYYDDDIVSVNILEELDFKSGTIPIGNISSNELNIELTNDDGRFRFGNTNSFFNDLLKKNRRIKVWLGFVLPDGSSDVTTDGYIVETIDDQKVGFVPYGVYWSSDWISSYRTMTVKTSARDRMEQLRTLTFDDSLVYENITLEELAAIVCESAVNKIGDLEYQVDDLLASYTVPVAWFDKISYFDAIKLIVQAGLTVAYFDREGVLIIGKKTGCIIGALTDDNGVPLSDDATGILIK